MYTCKYCQQEFEKSSALAGHVSHCSKNPNKKRTHEMYKNAARIGRLNYISKHPELYAEKDFDCTCNVCGNHYTVHITQKRFDKGDYRKTCSPRCANSHEHTQEWKDKISKGLKNSQKFYESYKNSLTKICKFCGKEFERKRKKDGHLSGTDFCSKECLSAFLSKNSKEKGCGGYISDKTYGHAGKYKGIRCDSSWELAFLVYHLEHDMFIERCHEVRKYSFHDKELKYFPDFVTDKGIIEIKGRPDERSIAKHNQHPDIIIYNYDDVKPMIQYTKQKYGSNFWDVLYDKKESRALQDRNLFVL